MAEREWTPAFPGQRPPFEPGNELSKAHGAFSDAKLTPVAQDVADQLRALVPAYRPADEPVLRLLSFVVARIEISNAWLNEEGLFRDGGELQPVLSRISTWENTARQYMRELGISKLARAELELDVAAAERLENVASLHAAAKLAEVVDGEADDSDRDGGVAA